MLIEEHILEILDTYKNKILLLHGVDISGYSFYCEGEAEVLKLPFKILPRIVTKSGSVDVDVIFSIFKNRKLIPYPYFPKNHYYNFQSGKFDPYCGEVYSKYTFNIYNEALDFITKILESI